MDFGNKWLLPASSVVHHHDAQKDKKQNQENCTMQHNNWCAVWGQGDKGMVQELVKNTKRKGKSCNHFTWTVYWWGLIKLADPDNQVTLHIVWLSVSCTSKPLSHQTLSNVPILQTWTVSSTALGARFGRYQRAFLLSIVSVSSFVRWKLFDHVDAPLVCAFTQMHSFIHIFCIPFTNYAECTCFHVCVFVLLTQTRVIFERMCSNTF